MNKTTTFAIIALIILAAIFLLMERSSTSQDGFENTSEVEELSVTQEFIINNRPIELPRTVAVNLVQKAQVGSFSNPEWTVRAADAGVIRWGGVIGENCASLRVATQNGFVECYDTEKGALYILDSEDSKEARDLFSVMRSQL